MSPGAAPDSPRHLTAALADPAASPPVFVWRVTRRRRGLQAARRRRRDGALLAEGASPVEVEAIGFMYQATRDAPPGAVGTVQPARWPCCARGYVYGPPTVEAERMAGGGVVLRHPGLPGGPPRTPPRRLRWPGKAINRGR